MPSHRFHRLVDRLLLGREYWWVHQLKDVAYVILGPRHRIVGHDMLFNLLLAILTNDPKVFTSAVLHDIVDRTIPSQVADKLDRLLSQSQSPKKKKM